MKENSLTQNEDYSDLYNIWSYRLGGSPHQTNDEFQYGISDILQDHGIRNEDDIYELSMEEEAILEEIESMVTGR